MPTWRWLGINDASLGDFDMDGAAPLLLAVTCQAGVEISDKFEPEDKAAPDGKLAFVKKYCNSPLTVSIPPGTSIDEMVVVDYCLDDINNTLVDGLHIQAGRGSKATILVRYTAKGGHRHFHGGYTYIDAEAGADIKLIKAQTLPGQDIHVDGVECELGEGAKAEVILCELGSAQTLADCNVRLGGKRSHADLYGLYLGDGKKKLDFNYRMEFAGRETEGLINVNGALAGEARKVLKSTIDFVRGSKGAKGREVESVLALGDRAVNISSPLLLCGEDDVEGEHATSTGKPDAGTIYYLMSRGFSEKEARKLLVEASFTPILNRIDEPELVGRIKEYIQEVINNEAK